MKTIIGLAIVAASLTWPSTASAQADNWRPWLGCWSLTTENVREGQGASRAAALSPAAATPAETPDASAPRTCVSRSGDGVTIVTTVPGQTQIAQTVVADGSAHSLVDGECRGVEHTEWATSGKRLFAKAEMTCGKEPPRTLTGIGLISPLGEWVDIRSFRIDGRDATRVTRYHRVSGVAVRMPPLGLDEIKEATSKVSSAAVEAAVAETRPRFDMNKRMLLDLASAQVPPNVIDVMVAVSYPDRFVIEEPAGSGPLAYLPPDASLPPLFDGFDPFYPGSFYPAYYYSPLGYGYLGRYDPLLLGAGVYPSGGGGIGGRGLDRPTASGSGRVINGEGYTRIHSAEPTTAQPRVVNRSSGTPNIDNASAGSSNSSGSSGGSSTSSGSAPAPSSSGGSGSASPQGYSGGGGGGGDTGRTAVPR